MMRSVQVSLLALTILYCGYSRTAVATLPTATSHPTKLKCSDCHQAAPTTLFGAFPIASDVELSAPLIFDGYSVLRNFAMQWSASFESLLTSIRLKISTFLNVILSVMGNQPSESLVEKTHVVTTATTSWARINATLAEMGGVRKLRSLVKEARHSRGASKWYTTVTDVELLRFLRARRGNTEDAWKMLTAHVEWRNSKYGADSAFTKTYFIDSPLHHEVFWIGANANGCPTLVVRTQVHEGMYYEEDPSIYER